MEFLVGSFCRRLSLTIMFLQYIHVVACISDCSFVLLSKIPFYEYTTVYPFSCLPCSQFCGYHEKGAQNYTAQDFFSFLLDNLGVDFLGHRMHVCLVV